jgi:hypothetical protein
MDLQTGEILDGTARDVTPPRPASLPAPLAEEIADIFGDPIDHDMARVRHEITALMTQRNLSPDAQQQFWATLHAKGHDLTAQNLETVLARMRAKMMQADADVPQAPALTSSGWREWLHEQRATFDSLRQRAPSASRLHDFLDQMSAALEDPDTSDEDGDRWAAQAQEWLENDPEIL